MSVNPDMEYSDDGEYDDYYNCGDDCDIDEIDPQKYDPESFVYQCLTVEEVEKIINESIERLNNVLKIKPALAKMLLQENRWNIEFIVEAFANRTIDLSNFHSFSYPNKYLVSSSLSQSVLCSVCAKTNTLDRFCSLACGHAFCKDCWLTYFELQISEGNSTKISCMAPNCNFVALEDLVLELLTRSSLREKYQQFAFQDYVKSHPELRFCPGPNCPLIIRSKDLSPKKTICELCGSVFCFQCGIDYHAPTDCHTFKKWITKCADDSETANYISANTKDCPKCHICIEKNGGCNHMQCFNCKQDFCWMCLGDWKSHGSEYYECSRYKDNPSIATESVHVQAREALKKYLHYYERWENHSKSLQLEQQTADNLKKRVNDKVMNGLGTWIDWQYLFNAASLLARCRFTLKYTYPYAYFMEPGSRKDLFEYQQAQLEAEIENLSWKIERVETNDLGDLQNQMDIAEKRRITLLKDFFPCTP